MQISNAKIRGAFFVVLSISSVFAKYSGGNGTEIDPYKIASLSDWSTLMNTSDDWNKHFILTADLNFQGVTIVPVGNTSIPFSGTFDGRNYKISNLTMILPNTECVALFGKIVSPAVIKKLQVENANIKGMNNVGGIVGSNGDEYEMNGGEIELCQFSGRVEATLDQSGGIAGLNSGTVEYCSVSASIFGYEDAGGICGSNCGTISRCNSSGSVYGYDEEIGGLAGDNNYYGFISESFSNSTVQGSKKVGGLCGENWGEFTNCYAKGSVSGTDKIGGFCGANYGLIQNAYSTGQVSGTYNVGGFCGYGDSTEIMSCFWDINTSGRQTSVGATGKNTLQMQTLSTFTVAGWDFSQVWQMPSNSYPELRWLFLGVCGDTNHPYPPMDFNQDCKVDILDFAIFASYWQVCTAPVCD